MYHKAQYLAIQGWQLQSIGTPEMNDAALELADLLVREYPDPSQLASAHFLRAECFLARDDLQGAIAAFRQSLQAQREYPKEHTLVHQQFARLVAIRPLPKLYREALQVLDEFAPGNWQCCSERALIYSGLKDHLSARRWATFGLLGRRVGRSEQAIVEKMHARVQKIAGEKVLGTTYYDLLVLIPPKSDFSLRAATGRLKKWASSNAAVFERQSALRVRLRFHGWALLFSTRKGPQAAQMNGWLAEQVPHPSLPHQRIAAFDGRVRISSEDTAPDMDAHYNDFLMAVDSFFASASGILHFDPFRHWDVE
jgi:hypothetical protein